MPLDQKHIEPWFNKQNHADHFRDNIRTNVIVSGISLELACGNCQLICHPDKEIRKKRYKMLTASGVIVENPDGSREAVSAAEAKNRLTAMDPETRALYEKT